MERVLTRRESMSPKRTARKPLLANERGIRDVRADEVRGYAQCHWFAGVAGWSLALRLAGWPDDEPCWTSCPCQPLSVAGERQGHADERHLWPTFHGLIAPLYRPRFD